MEPANSSLPHNRSSAFFDDDGTFSSRFRDSINRWSTALLNDDGIIKPIQPNTDHPEIIIVMPGHCYVVCPQHEVVIQEPGEGPEAICIRYSDLGGTMNP